MAVCDPQVTDEQPVPVCVARESTHQLSAHTREHDKLSALFGWATVRLIRRSRRRVDRQRAVPDRWSRSRDSPRRMRALMVPSGVPSSAATSRYVWPPK